ncbi:MAG: hypothetical protein IE909_02900 [Campylobacterales bacterium]|nr:hypothetical protein [Campylobacterales bacterium]
MKRLAISVIPVESIEIVTTKVTEKINEKYLEEFLQTTLKSKNLTVGKNSYYFYNFFIHSLQYQIVLIQTPGAKNFLPEPFLLLQEYEQKDLDCYELFVSSSYYFILYQNKIYYFEKFDQTTIHIDDLVLFLEHKLLISIKLVHQYSPQQIDHLKNNIEIPKKIMQNSQWKKFKNSQLKLYCKSILLGLVCLAMACVYNLWNQKNTLEHKKELLSSVQNNQLIKKVQNVQHNQSGYTVLINLFEQLQPQEIFVKKVLYRKKELMLTLYSTNSESLLEVLEKNKKLKFKTMKKDLANNIVIMEIGVEL